jgi:3',5'-nucleoside bisphosphate phosphatase
VGVTFDLHTHTIHSDGTTTPTRNAELAAAAGVAGFALTDHDTLEGLAEAAEACSRLGLEFVPGVELSTEDEGRSVHILGYWVDPEHAGLQEECDRLRHEREHRAVAMLAKLAAHGLPVSMERVRAIAAGAPIGRPHLAAAMVEAGVVADHKAAFDEWIGDHGRAYVVKHALPPAKGIDLIRAAGGVAVLAHPGVPGDLVPGQLIDTAFVQRLRAAGLAGLEVDHPCHDEVAATFWRQVASQEGLEVTGSSDFHGDRKEAKIALRTTTAAAVAALRARCGSPTGSIVPPTAAGRPPAGG